MELMVPEIEVKDDAAAAARRRAVGVAMLIGASVLWSLAGVSVKMLQLHQRTSAPGTKLWTHL